MNFFLFCGNTVHLLAFYILIFDILKKQNCSGISGKTQLLYSIVFVTRYTDLVTTYISFYNTSMKVLFIWLTFLTIFLIYHKYGKTYDEEYDTFWIILPIILAGALAPYINYYVNSYNYWRIDMVQEILWTFSIYLEVMAILPQYHMFKKSGTGKRILPYISTLCAYRSLYIANWIYRYLEDHHLDKISLVSGCIQTLILITMIIEIQLHKEEMPKWQEITQVFAIDLTRNEESTKNCLYEVKTEQATEKLLLK